MYISSQLVKYVTFLWEVINTHIALITFSKQVAGSVAVAVVITSELAVTLSWADLMSVGLLSYLPKNRSTGCGVVVPSLKLTAKAPEN